MSILFFGDPHGEWPPLFAAVQQHRPAAVVLLGDCGLDVPLRQKLAPVWDLVPDWRWIPGNHDADTEDLFDHLFTDHPRGNLHAVVSQLDGRIVAGLGGVYRSKVWYPQLAAEPNALVTRAKMIKDTARSDRWRGGLPRRHRDSIFYEDHEALGRLQADILVTHEAPSCHRNGFIAIDQLAQQMGAKLIVHGHHHVSYESHVDGIRVKGLAQAEPWLLEQAELPT